MVGAIGSSSEPRLGVGVTLCDPGQQPITSAIHRSLHGGTRRRRGKSGVCCRKNVGKAVRLLTPYGFHMAFKMILSCSARSLVVPMNLPVLICIKGRLCNRSS